jgi:hypothetical protein
VTGTALVPLGIVTVCCGFHRPHDCCDPLDCGPCCPECPTCPTVATWTPEYRKTRARECRAWTVELLTRFQEIRQRYVTTWSGGPL